MHSSPCLPFFFICLIDRYFFCDYPFNIFLLAHFLSVLSFTKCIHSSVCTIRSYFLSLSNTVCIYDSRHKGDYFLCCSNEKWVSVSLFLLKKFFCQGVLLIISYSFWCTSPVGFACRYLWMTDFGNALKNLPRWNVSLLCVCWYLYTPTDTCRYFKNGCIHLVKMKSLDILL